MLMMWLPVACHTRKSLDHSWWETHLVNPLPETTTKKLKIRRRLAEFSTKFLKTILKPRFFSFFFHGWWHWLYNWTSEQNFIQGLSLFAWKKDLLKFCKWKKISKKSDVWKIKNYRKQHYYNNCKQTHKQNFPKVIFPWSIYENFSNRFAHRFFFTFGNVLLVFIELRQRR